MRYQVIYDGGELEDFIQFQSDNLREALRFYNSDEFNYDDEKFAVTLMDGDTILKQHIQS